MGSIASYESKRLLCIINTVHSKFKNVNFYIIGGQGVIVATNSDLAKDYHEDNVNKMNLNKSYDGIKSFYSNDFNTITKSRLLSSEETDKVLFNTYGKNDKFFTSNDNNLYLEYNTPKGNSIKEDTLKIIVNLLEDKKIKQ